MRYTDEYANIQKEFHQRDDYGISGGKWSAIVENLCTKLNTRNVLDYGCGKCLLSKNLPFAITNYDPFIPGLDNRPDPHDFIVCTDVLEHIEPDCLNDVLDDIASLTKRVAMLVIAIGPAQKFLPDGRNAHLIQENMCWWLPKLYERFEIQSLQNFGYEFAVMCTPKGVVE